MPEPVELNSDNLTKALEHDIEEAAALKRQMAPLQSLKREYDNVRSRIEFAMMTLKSKRTEAVSGFYAVRQEKVSIVITDEDAVIRWMDDNDIDPTPYLKLDSDMVKQLAERWFKENGEYLPGIESQLTEFVTLKEVKK